MTAEGDGAVALLSTPLTADHLAAGATLTAFAGWRMPLRFSSELAEHHAVRRAAGLFDLSHMAQLEISGPQAADLLEATVVSRTADLAAGRARYTMLTDSTGGVLDDLIVYRLADDDFLVIANAANRHVVLDAFTLAGESLAAAVIDRTEERALIALQGPVAADVLSDLGVDLSGLRYYAIRPAQLDAVPVLVARTGYTGEDGVELVVPAAAAVDVWHRLLDAGTGRGVLPAGLACRDTLRLEAGMPLYGNELTAGRTPIEAGLGRVVHTEGRTFPGSAALSELERQPAAAAGRERLVGLSGTGRRAARAGTRLRRDSADVGVVTSGVLSPTLGHPIALAYVTTEAAEVGTVLDADVRGTAQQMTVVPVPFYRRDRQADRATATATATGAADTGASAKRPGISPGGPGTGGDRDDALGVDQSRAEESRTDEEDRP